MAGAFTHILIADAAKRKRTIIGSLLYRLLNKYSEFVAMGSVSPDLPYLSFKMGKTNWADLMHYEKTNGIIIQGVETLRKVWAEENPSEEEEIKLAWLLGFASHLVSDATIHPIVQAVVGPYELNAEEHRICEMTQDSLVYYNRKNGEIRYGEYSSVIKFCKESIHFDALMDFWKDLLQKTYTSQDEEPDPSAWFGQYATAIDTVEGGSSLVALFRHIGVGTGYLYQTQEEILAQNPERHEKYYTKVKLPDGATKSFSTQGFDRAVTNVCDAWKNIYTCLKNPIGVSRFVRNWNLDTGVDMESDNNTTTFWV